MGRKVKSRSDPKWSGSAVCVVDEIIPEFSYDGRAPEPSERRHLIFYEERSSMRRMRMRSPETHLPDGGINPTGAAHVWAHLPSEIYLREVIAREIKKASTAGFLRPEPHVAGIIKGYEAHLLKHNDAERSVEQIAAKRSALLQTQEDAKHNKFINTRGVQAAIAACEEELKKAVEITSESAEKLPGELAKRHWFEATINEIQWVK